MYLLRGQEGVAQVLGDFEDDKHYHIIMVGAGPGDDLWGIFLRLAGRQAGRQAGRRWRLPLSLPEKCSPGPAALCSTHPCFARTLAASLQEWCSGGDLYHRSIIASPPLDEHWVCTKVGGQVAGVAAWLRGPPADRLAEELQQT
jgi:hypothetical protein